jgi:hypothetical protein
MGIPAANAEICNTYLLHMRRSIVIYRQSLYLSWATAFPSDEAHCSKPTRMSVRPDETAYFPT